MLTKAEERMADRNLIIKDVRGRHVITLNDKTIMKATRLYGYFVIISNEKMDASIFLREYLLRKKNGGRLLPQ